MKKERKKWGKKTKKKTQKQLKKVNLNTYFYSFFKDKIANGGRMVQYTYR